VFTLALACSRVAGFRGAFYHRAGMAGTESRESGADRRSLYYPAASVALLLVAAVVCFALGRFGASSRSYGEVRLVREGPAVRVASNAAEAIEMWHASGLRGRVLVHVGHYLHFVEPSEQYGRRAIDEFPYGIEERMLAHAADPGMLWVLMRVNVARELVNVLPPAVYTESVGTEPGAVGARRTVDASYGLKRTIVDHFPTFDEPVLLSIDASMFGTASGRALLAELHASSMLTDQIVFNLAEDNPRVGDAERQLIREFADTLRGEVAAP
jgi:hypothetical protein